MQEIPVRLYRIAKMVKIPIPYRESLAKYVFGLIRHTGTCQQYSKCCRGMLIIEIVLRTLARSLGSTVLGKGSRWQFEESLKKGRPGSATGNHVVLTDVTHGQYGTVQRPIGSEPSTHGGREVITLLMSPCNGMKPPTKHPYVLKSPIAPSLHTSAWPQLITIVLPIYSKH